MSSGFFSIYTSIISIFNNIIGAIGQYSKNMFFLLFFSSKFQSEWECNALSARFFTCVTILCHWLGRSNTPFMHWNKDQSQREQLSHYMYIDTNDIPETVNNILYGYEVLYFGRKPSIFLLSACFNRNSKLFYNRHL